jgi:hypothetical protein
VDVEAIERIESELDTFVENRARECGDARYCGHLPKRHRQAL